MNDWIWIFLIILVLLCISSALNNRKGEGMVNLSSLGNLGNLGNLNLGNLGNLNLGNFTDKNKICGPLYQQNGTTCAVPGQGNLIDSVKHTKCYNAYVNDLNPQGMATYLGEVPAEACSNISNLCGVYGTVCNAPNLNHLQ
ncbi:Hypothetical protein KVN_LOCUS39 [uncultured virus]|nr:Hypothetical protein KVN_LOCUS39 [uncultured virus]